MSRDLYCVISSYSSYDFIIIINDKRYLGTPLYSNGYEIKRTFDEMARHSVGRALTWVKDNAKLELLTLD